jgi:hypothetical protein
VPTATPAPALEDSPLVESPSPPSRVVVPDVVGAKLPRARRVLRRAGLIVDTTSKSSPQRPRTVLRQRPLGGLEVRPSRTVVLVVAKPPPPPPDNDYSPPIPPGPDVDCAGGSGTVLATRVRATSRSDPSRSWARTSMAWTVTITGSGASHEVRLLPIGISRVVLLLTLAGCSGVDVQGGPEPGPSASGAVEAGSPEQ